MPSCGEIRHTTSQAEVPSDRHVSASERPSDLHARRYVQGNPDPPDRSSPRLRAEQGVFLLERDLPADRTLWPALFGRIMGSPCPQSRQLNGLGGGLSSLSKICVLGESEVPGAVDFTFAQVGTTDGKIDYHGTCGNLMSAVPLFAIAEGLVRPTTNRETGQLEVLVNDRNTAKEIVTSLPGRQGKLDWTENYEISGVSGLGIRVSTQYRNCGGSKTGRLWPTGNKQDSIQVGERKMHASLVDGPNPAIFCDASSDELRDLQNLRDPDVLALLEQFRLQGTVQMGFARDLSHAKTFQAVPKLSLLRRVELLSSGGGRGAGDDDIGGIHATTLSMGTPHKAIPMTIGLSLAIAMATPGSIPYFLASGKRIHHPTGHVDVDASLQGRAGVTATVVRSARRLMVGEIFL